MVQAAVWRHLEGIWPDNYTFIRKLKRQYLGLEHWIFLLFFSVRLTVLQTWKKFNIYWTVFFEIRNINLYYCFQHGEPPAQFVHIVGATNLTLNLVHYLKVNKINKEIRLMFYNFISGESTTKMTLKPGRCLLTSFTLLFFIPLSSYQDEMAFQQTIQVRNKKYRVGFGRSNFTRLNQKVAAFFQSMESSVFQ